MAGDTKAWKGTTKVQVADKVTGQPLPVPAVALVDAHGQVVGVSGELPVIVIDEEVKSLLLDIHTLLGVVVQHLEAITDQQFGE